VLQAALIPMRADFPFLFQTYGVGRQVRVPGCVKRALWPGMLQAYLLEHAAGTLYDMMNRKVEGKVVLATEQQKRGTT
jgi:hypothetical protein